MQDASIDLSLIRDIAAVPVALVALPSLIFDKHATFAAIRQLAGDNLIREGAHEWRKSSSEDFQWMLFTPTAL
ncbi:MAG: hypothetical protein DMG48_01195 [Acidobacteria bacterium]|nr:MAG: hypothetical protein DMG48_01195 [Acidobacteriota bacterium]